ncbi:MAG TPA: hypothetical protein VFI47_27865, partial [Acidimicrobiales bacterium]|nr:hypothetical protein [Acidimicrobiales bacterium]
MASLDVVRSRIPWGGRRHRHAARRDRFAHIEVRGVDGPKAHLVRAEVEQALVALPSVGRAWLNGPLGRVVVELAEDDVDVGDLVEVVVDVEQRLEVHHDRFPLDRPDHPADVGPIVRDAVAAAAATVAAGAAAAGRLAHLPRLPAEVGGLVSLVASDARARNAVGTLAGPALTNVGLALLNAGLQAATQGPIGSLADLGHRASLMAEGRARQAAWGRAQDHLHAPGREPGTAAGGDGASRRDVPLRHGPVESYVDQASVASLAAAGGTFLATADPRRSMAAALATTPKAARLGR